jgi:medium-chain acyl-[acyl-carrier-protein] hydrolase
MTPSVQLCRFSRSSAGRLRLFCIPYAGAGAGVFRSWPALLPPEIEVYGLSLPGRADRLCEEPFTELRLMIIAATKALKPFLNRPFALFGHSMGALVAFELVRYLRELCQTLPRHLFVSGFRAPHLPDPRPTLHDLPRRDLLEELRRLNGMAPEVLKNSELIDLVLAPLRADFRVVQTYSHSPQPPLSCPITVYGGTADPDIRLSDLEAWRRHTRGMFAVTTLPGDHFFLNTALAPLLKDLGGKLALLTHVPTVPA